MSLRRRSGLLRGAQRGAESAPKPESFLGIWPGTWEGAGSGGGFELTFEQAKEGLDHRQGLRDRRAHLQGDAQIACLRRQEDDRQATTSLADDSAEVTARRDPSTATRPPAPGRFARQGGPHRNRQRHLDGDAHRSRPLFANRPLSSAFRRKVRLATMPLLVEDEFNVAMKLQERRWHFVVIGPLTARSTQPAFDFPVAISTIRRARRIVAIPIDSASRGTLASLPPNSAGVATARGRLEHRRGAWRRPARGPAR